MMPLLIIGFVSILGQVVLLRELSVAFFGVELIYTLAIAVWLFWTAIGAAVGRGQMEPRRNQVDFLFLSFALSLPAEIAGIRSLRVLFAAAPGAYLSFSAQILSMAISLLPAGLLSGWIFQWAAKRYIGSRETLARAYAIECLGGIFGGLASVALLHFGLGNLAVGLLCSLAAVALPLASARTERLSFTQITAGLLCLMMISALWNYRILDHGMTRWNHAGFLDSVDTPYGRITLTSLYGQIAVFENDALSFETEGTGAEELAHLAALQHPSPARILILGGGVEGIAAEILQHVPESVDYVELNRALLEIALRYGSATTRNALAADNMHLHIADPRRFLASEGNQYDLILLGMPEPSSGESNRFYTREFFALSASRLNPGGVLAFKIPSSENYWTPQLRQRTASLSQALRPAFDDAVILPGTANIIIAGRGKLTRDPAVMAERLRSRRIHARMVSGNYIRYLYGNDRFAEISQMLQTGPALPNTDARPSCYRFTMMIWLSKFIPEAAFLDASLPNLDQPLIWPALWYVFGFVSLSLYLSRKWQLLRRSLLTVCAAFMGIALETSLMMYYQVKSGVLYQDIGLLLTAFMAGLAAGAWICDYSQRRCGKIHSPSYIPGILLLGGFILISTLVAWGIRMSAFSGLIACGLLMAAAGFLVSGIFAYAASQAAGDQRRIVGPLYAADLIGGCLGSAAVSLFLIPFAGLDVTALMMIPLALAALLLV